MALVRSVKPRNYHKGSFVSVQVETLATIGCAQHNWVLNSINRMLRIRDSWESGKIGRGPCECVLGIDDLQRPAVSFHRKSDEEYTCQTDFENDDTAQGSDVKQTRSEGRPKCMVGNYC